MMYMILNKKLISILLVLLFLVSTSSVVYAEDVDYSLTKGAISLIVEENGLLHVKETINYHFDSSANGIYRTIPLKENQEIKNLKVTTKGAYCDYSTFTEEGNKKIKVYLYKDKEKTKKITPNTNIKVEYEYDFTKVIKTYTDTGELHYKLWGEDWDVGVNQVKANIYFNDKKGIQYWINPYNQINKEVWNNNTLKVESNYIYSGNYLEIRSTIPLTYFKNPIYAQKIDSPGLEKIKKIQKDYENSNNLANIGFLVLDTLSLLSIIIPITIYLKQGREPKINYRGIYEIEPPTNDSPVFVNAMQGGFGSIIGLPDTHGFQAAIMDLINRKYISISKLEEGKLKNSIVMEINYSKKDELEYFEKEVLSILRPFEIDGKISLDYMESSLRGSVISKTFSKNLNSWKENFKNTYLSKSEIEKYFIETGSTNMKIYGLTSLIVGVLIIYFSVNSIVNSAYYSFFVGFFISLIGIICIFLPSTIGGRWTEYGAEYNAKWKNFKKYLKDYSLMKENPPESIAIWNEYLVYATALGIADNVYKSMKIVVYNNNENYINNPLFLFCYFGGHNTLNHAINTGINAANDSSGRIGGGSGGGGGGAF